MTRSLPLTLALLLLASPALAGTTLRAGPVQVADGDNLRCMLVNLSNKDAQGVVIQTRIADGSSNTATSPIVSPGEGRVGSTTNNSGNAALGWCTFNVDKGKTKDLFATACSAPIQGSCTAAVSAR